MELLEELLSQRLYGEHRRKKWWDRLTLVYDYHLKEKLKVKKRQEVHLAVVETPRGAVRYFSLDLFIWLTCGMVLFHD